MADGICVVVCRRVQPLGQAQNKSAEEKAGCLRLANIGRSTSRFSGANEIGQTANDDPER